MLYSTSTLVVAPSGVTLPPSGCLGFHHGGTGTLLYRVWSNMKGRCTNPQHPRYRLYGGRGISICPAWLNSFAQFRLDALAAGYEKGLEIDRIDPNGDYVPSNIRYVSRKEQVRNTRSTRWLTAFGETKKVAEWVEDERCKVTRYCLISRITLGWSPEWAITAPSGSRKNGGNVVH
jgi:hypothetical protein